MASIVLVGCSTLEKPDPKACFNLAVGGYGGCTTAITKQRTILSAEDWARLKSGPGFWLLPEEFAKLKIFLLKLCEKSKMCKEQDVKQINEDFDLFLNTPSDIMGLKPT